MNLDQIKKQALREITGTDNAERLETLRIKYLGRKGKITQLFATLSKLNGEERKTRGQELNILKQALEQALLSRKTELQNTRESLFLAKDQVDVTQPALPLRARGHVHPNTAAQDDLEDLFASMGFMIVDGPELESDYFNFTAVNIGPAHPARDMQDTFYIKDHPNWLMRTHTSSVQVRAMQEYGAPLRVIVPGRCFRNEATDVRHEHTFYQLEGVVIDREITLAHMKGVLAAVAEHVFGQGTKVRLRPKFYPFVEPGVNGEVTCFLCKSKGCRLCKNSGWLEIFGAGMIHPNVLKAGHIDPKFYQGFAFGLGLTRLVMLKYGIDDIRLLMSGDLKFLRQF